MEVRAAAVALDRMLPGLTRTDDGRAILRACFEDPSGVATLVWAAAAGSRTDVEVSALLVAAQGFHAGPRGHRGPHAAAGGAARGRAALRALQR